MINTRFEVYKLKRELKRSGVDYEFLRAAVNDYGEPSGDMKKIGTVLGLYHENSEHIMVSMTDTTQVRTKIVPSILCLYGDAAPLKITIGDVVKINDKSMRVTGLIDIQEWNLITDISLEVVDDGN